MSMMKKGVVCFCPYRAIIHNALQPRALPWAGCRLPFQGVAIRMVEQGTMIYSMVNPQWSMVNVQWGQSTYEKDRGSLSL